MRRFALAAAVVLALSPLAGLVSASPAASAAVAQQAAAARAAMPEACNAWYPYNEFGQLYANGTTAGSQVFVSGAINLSNEVWCQDLDGVPSGWELLRLDGTSQCAEYSGRAGGGNSSKLILEACNSTVDQQLWDVFTSEITGQYVAYTESPGTVACLSSDKPPTMNTPEKAFMVAPSAGYCTGAGGQSWTSFPSPP
jgi:hypothetical protein